MPNNTVSDWSTTPASNTEVGGVDLAENSMRPRDVNNAIRTMMAQIRTALPTGTGIGGTVGATDNRLVRSDGTGASTLQATGITVDDSNNVSGVGNLNLAATVQFGPQIIVGAEYNGLQGGYVYFQKGRASGPTQSGDEMGTFIGAARDSASAMVNSAYFTFATTAAPAAGSVDGKVFFATVQSAVSAVRMTIQSGLLVGSATGGDKGAGTLNATGLYVQGVSISPPGAPVTKTADFTVAATEQHLINNKSGSTCTVTLPTASSFPGRELTIKTIQAQTVVSASSNVVPLGTGTAGTAILSANAGRWAKLVSDATNWVIMEGVV